MRLRDHEVEPSLRLRSLVRTNGAVRQKAAAEDSSPKQLLEGAKIAIKTMGYNDHAIPKESN